MINRIFSEEKLKYAFENKAPDIYSGKMKALGKAYGFSYPFLKFYANPENSAVISVYYGSAVIFGECDEETAWFLKETGVTEILMSERNYESFFSNIDTERLYIMEYTERGGKASELSSDTSYEKVYEILKDGFSISFEDWYTDTCHNVRHGISEVFTLGDKATATKMFSVDGISLISLVAVKNEHKGKGYGNSIIRSVSEKLADNTRVYVICKKELVPFYTKNGYKTADYCRQINFKTGER